MESTDYKQIALIPPNPTPSRGFPVFTTVQPVTQQYLAYGCKTNVVLRDLTDPTKSLIYTDFLNKITTVKYSPDGKYLAIGTDNGRVRLAQYNEQSKEFVVKKEHPMLTGDVYQISFSDDGSKMIAAGSGKDFFAKAVVTESGTKQGDLFGPTKNILTLDISKNKKTVLAGENYEIYVFDGFPPKQEKSINVHTNFVNKISFSQDGSLFVTASSDKTINLFDGKSLEQVSQVPKAHNKGVIDVQWIDNETVVSCSTDNTISFWKIKEGAHQKTLRVVESEEEKVELQQLGLQILKDQILSVTLNSNINVWSRADVESNKLLPSQIIQGHTSHVSRVLTFQNQLISADQDGRVLSWSSDLKQGNLFQDQITAFEVSHLFSNQESSIYIAYNEGTLKRSIRVDPNTFSTVSKVKLDSILLSVTVVKKNLIGLTNKQQLIIIDGDSLSEIKRVDAKPLIEGNEPTQLTYSSATNQLWIGDKKGLIHILDADSLEKKHTIEKKHNHGLTAMTSSRDGKLIASGDSYRYIYVFNSETREEVACFPYHTGQIIQLDFNKDATLLLTTSHDRNVGIANLQSKSKKIITKPNEKDVRSAVFDDENRVITGGYDCAVRVWSL